MPYRRDTISAATLAVVAVLLAGCGGNPLIPSLPDENRTPVDPERFELLARFVHISDAHVVDEESPGRLSPFAGLSRSAWRPQESYSIQLLDGTIRAVNKLHATRHRFDFLVHTGDSCDNAQLNELQWFVGTFDGGEIDPLSGLDNRTEVPDPQLDQHATFVAQGLYRQGVHGTSPTIPWYSVIGNHDRFGGGIFPIIYDLYDVRISPLPLEDRIGFFAPKYLDPVGRLSWTTLSPAQPGPPFGLTIPRPVQANPDRRFITDGDYVTAHLASSGEPPGHGFSAEHPNQTWYSVSPKPGLRLIALNSSTPREEIPTLVYADGAISPEQRTFLIAELEKAQAAGEIVIIASHHPSALLQPSIGTSLTPGAFRQLLDRFDNVKLHIAGHTHSNVVLNHGGYAEVVTGSIIDFPQRGRVIELWRPRGRSPLEADGAPVELRYWYFSYYDEVFQPGQTYEQLFRDEHEALRQRAAELSGIAPPD